MSDAKTQARQLEAVALAYRQSDSAPRVVAKGRGLIAEEIISRAKEHGVYVHESPELLSLLVQVDIDEHIPSQLYLAVAELLAWLYRIEHGETGLPPPDFSGISRQGSVNRDQVSEGMGKGTDGVPDF